MPSAVKKTATSELSTSLPVSTSYANPAPPLNQPVMVFRYKKSVPNVRWNIANRMTKKIGIPQMRCVSTRSARSERERFSFFLARS